MLPQKAVSLSFTEDMHGFYIQPESTNIPVQDLDTYRFACQQGEALGQALKFRLTITIDDIESFTKDPKLEAKASGYVECEMFGGKCDVKDGIFNLFVNSSNSRDPEILKEMHYTLKFISQDGSPFTFYGFKAVKSEEMAEAWNETTTLYTRVWSGHEESGPIVAYGVLRLTASDFARQLGTFKSSGENLSSRAHALLRFAEVFAANLWDAYEPDLLKAEPEIWQRHIVPINTLDGVKDAAISQYSFNTEDNYGLNLTRFKRKETKNVVLLIHGLTTSSDMFIMPEHYNLTQYLLDNGFTDVWALDWRGSRRHTYNLKPNRDTIDHLALFDMPQTIAEMRKYLDPSTKIHVVSHCVGSIGFMCSLAAGRVKGISSVVSNSVSLKPTVSWFSKLKLIIAPFLVEYVLRLPYISPEFSYLPGPAQGKLISKLVSLFHRECKEPACHMVSFMWGSGFPAAYQHRNLSPVTHRRLKDLFGGTSVNYHRHIRKMIFAKGAVPTVNFKEERLQLPDSYLEAAAKELPPTLFLTGSENKIFPGSNQATYDQLRSMNEKLPIQFHSFKNYGHQDVYMGRRCADEVFPRILQFLNRHKG